MTIIEAIHQADALIPNAYTQSMKVKWLSDLDGMIKKTILDLRERNADEEEIEFNGYDDNTPLDTELLVKYPFEEIYIKWLESKIDYYNQEYSKYNNVAMTFSDLLQDFTMDYNRTHIPKQLTEGGVRYY